MTFVDFGDAITGIDPSRLVLLSQRRFLGSTDSPLNYSLTAPPRTLLLDAVVVAPGGVSSNGYDSGGGGASVRQFFTALDDGFVSGTIRAPIENNQPLSTLSVAGTTISAEKGGNAGESNSRFRYIGGSASRSFGQFRWNGGAGNSFSSPGQDGEFGGLGGRQDDARSGGGGAGGPFAGRGSDAHSKGGGGLGGGGTALVPPSVENRFVIGGVYLFFYGVT